ncbi:MAG: beta-galactosidase [Nocardioides sp.]
MSGAPGWRTTARGFGGDYNPEQWPVEVHEEDVALMREAGVDLVTLGVFAWAQLEVAPDDFRFQWLDEIVARLHAGGIGIDLATATASPPPWLTAAHPEMLPVTAEGTRLWPGGRQAFCPSSPVYRAHAERLCRRLAERYGSHPALRLWHVSNEIGCHNALCYCDVSAEAFRHWLENRYDTIDALNEAWGTAFWSQHYTDFSQVLPPRAVTAIANPGQQLDFRRFSSAELLANFVAERDILHEVSPGVPVTTNFMVMSHTKDMDYWAWSREVDVVSNDHYVVAADPEGFRELAFSADLVRGLAGGNPWILMEQAASAVNWQPRNVAKQPGELTRNSLQHVARGADAVLFFQWRASRAGAEKFHSALLPHAGTDTRVWREVVALSALLDRIDESVGATSDNECVIVFDWEAWWACELDSHPSVEVTYLDRAHALHRSLTDLGIGVDFAHPEQDLSGYRLIVVPTLYAVSDAAVEQITSAAAAGATVLVTYFSGIVDLRDQIRLGGYPGAFRDLLGVRVEEFCPLRADQQVRLTDGSRADVWTEHVHLDGATSVADYADGPLSGVPAITRHAYGQGTAWYLATRLDQPSIDALVSTLVNEAGLTAAAPAPGVERVRRVGSDGRGWTFLINHTVDEVVVAIRGLDLVSGAEAEGTLVLGGGQVAVVRDKGVSGAGG